MPNGAGRLRILLVDDDVQVRSTTAALLEEMNHAAVAVGTGAEALRLLGSDMKLDLSLVDYTMSGMTGAELLTHSQTVRPALKVLLMTGYAEAEALPEDVRRQHS